MREIACFPYRAPVTVSAASKDLTIKATVKTELGISDTADDAQIDTWIHQWSAAIVSYCKREFAEETLAADFETDHCVTTLWLPRTPVTSITTVVEDGETLDAADYRLNAQTGELWRLDSDSRRTTWADCVEIAVTFVAGYATLPDLPHDVERCCIDLVKMSYYARQRDPMLRSIAVPDVITKQFQIGANMEDAPGGLPGEIARRLDAYRVMVVG